MRIALGRYTAFVLQVLLFPMWVLLRAVWRLTRGNRKRQYYSTLTGDPLAYDGNRPVVVAVWADWASIWTAATADIIERMKNEFDGKCEFVYVDGDSDAVRVRYGTEILPTVIVYRRGNEVQRFVNLVDVEVLRKALGSLSLG